MVIMSETKRQKINTYARLFRLKNRDRLRLQKHERYIKNNSKENREKSNAKKRVWILNNLEKHREQARKNSALYKIRNPTHYKEYYEKNKTKIAEKRRIYRLKHPELFKQRSKEYIKKYPEKVLKHRLSCLGRQANFFNMKTRQYKFALDLWSKSVKKLANNTCQVCDKPAQHSHHIFPKARYPELSLNLNNGIALCLEHHREIHSLNSLQKRNRI